MEQSLSQSPRGITKWCNFITKWAGITKCVKDYKEGNYTFVTLGLMETIFTGTAYAVWEWNCMIR